MQHDSGIDAVAASMGPRLFSRGNKAVGAHDRQGRDMLQWGHGYLAVEICLEVAFEDLTVPLQWGHGYLAVEMRPPRLSPPWCPPLQWGHGYLAVEIARLVSHRRPKQRLQWGHGYLAVEIARVVNLQQTGSYTVDFEHYTLVHQTPNRPHRKTLPNFSPIKHRALPRQIVTTELLEQSDPKGAGDYTTTACLSGRVYGFPKASMFCSISPRAGPSGIRSTWSSS